MKSLAKITLPASLKSLKANAFADDAGLVSVVFEGDSIESIGMRAFANCSNLVSISLPEITESFGAAAFEHCVQLEKVVFTGSVATNATNQFSGSDFIEHLLFCGNNPGFELGDFVTCYARVTFESSDHELLGSADILVGTRWENINDALPASSIMAGSVPALPAGSKEWLFSEEGESLMQASLATASPSQGNDPTDPTDPTDPQDPNGANSEIVAGKSYRAGSNASRALYQVLSPQKRTVAYQSCKSADKTKAVIPSSVSIEGKKYAVVKVSPKAFSTAKKVKTVIVKSKKIASFSKAFAKSHVDKVKVPKAKKAGYEKLLKKKRCGRAVKVV